MIKRRGFIKLGGAASALIFLPHRPIQWLARAPVEALIKNTLYKGTEDGKVYTSKDRGKTWELNVAFGEDISIQDIFAGKHGLVYLKAGYRENSFLLSAAPDDKTWRTVW